MGLGRLLSNLQESSTQGYGGNFDFPVDQKKSVSCTSLNFSGMQNFNFNASTCDAKGIVNKINQVLTHPGIN